ncbi:hypothetical protein SAMN02910369_00020 [Lachnospiraceae bacterium NE2001]|nr:hypothetical protein SAMN02910369_00020 [Lachnospiraceae bacterium NE2001]
MKNIRTVITLILNILIVVFACIGIYKMVTFTGEGSGLTSTGIENFKYFTVLSNVFAGVVSLVWLVFFAMKKTFPVLPKLMAASSVGLTFLIIAAFLAPLYPDLNLYEGGNLWFHLILPLTAMLEFVLLDTSDTVVNNKAAIESQDNPKENIRKKKAADRKKRIPFRYTFISASLALLYGIGYMVNILINGIGVWPETNDWYGFLNWGWTVGFVIFGFIVLMDWGIACLLRFLNRLKTGDGSPSEK